MRLPMKLLLLVLSPVQFDVTTPESEPLGGSESCAAYLATALSGAVDVTLLANTSGSRTVRGVRHVPLTPESVRALLTMEHFDAIIVPNAPAAGPLVRSLSPRSRLVLWNHHAPDQPKIAPVATAEELRAFDCVIYVSEWQRAATEARFKGPTTRACVIGNGLTPAFEAMFGDADELRIAKSWRAAYTSTPFRGLKFLLDVYRRLESPPVLDVFSSMQVYRGDDGPYRALYAEAQAHPAMRYRGSVSQTELAAAMRSVSFLCYPCTFAETFCIAALEAMAAGAQVVSTELGALSATTMGYGMLLPMAAARSHEEFVAEFSQLYSAALRLQREDPKAWAERMFEQSAAVNRSATWRHRAMAWLRLLEDLKSAPGP
jgi:glycosyltransferase involved in cell wall biosynthesis